MVDDPKTYKEEIASRDSYFLKDAIKDEMNSAMSKLLGDDTLNTYNFRLIAKDLDKRNVLII